VIRQATSHDSLLIKNLLNSVYNRPNEADFLGAIRDTDTFIPGLSLVAMHKQEVYGYLLMSRVGIRTVNEILPTLTILPFCVSKKYRGKGIGRRLIDTGFKRAKEFGFTSCVTIDCGDYFKRYGFQPARDEFGLELYFDVPDGDFLAIELVDDSLYRKSGFLIFPQCFSKIDPVMIS